VGQGAPLGVPDEADPRSGEGVSALNVRGTSLALTWAMSRHPISRYWKRLISFPALAAVVFVILLWTQSYLLAIAALIIAVVGYMVYTTGESSDLPGTAGKHDENIPT
jgi:hypothetical protein